MKLVMLLYSVNKNRLNPTLGFYVVCYLLPTGALLFSSLIKFFSDFRSSIFQEVMTDELLMWIEVCRPSSKANRTNGRDGLVVMIILNHGSVLFIVEDRETKVKIHLSLHQPGTHSTPCYFRTWTSRHLYQLLAPNLPFLTIMKIRETSQCAPWTARLPTPIPSLWT